MTISGEGPFSVPGIYKGKKGSITVSSQRRVIEWIPSVPPGTDASSETILIKLDVIAGLQASPPTNSKARLRIVTHGKEQFVFELATRPNLEALKSVLSLLAGSSSSSSSSQPAPSPAPSSLLTGLTSSTGVVSSATISSTLNQKPSSFPLTNGMTDAELLANIELQQSLLKSNQELKQQFLETVVAQKLPGPEFWSSRIPLLRMHSLVKIQQRGPYNVLASIKPVSTGQAESGSSQAQVKVSLSQEKIRDIFQQYPVVRKAYNDNVPPLTEAVFWSRFFLSKLCRKLRGERNAVTDAPDSVMDKYLELDEDGMTVEEREAIENEHATKVMRFVDVEGNEEDDSQRAGNRPDITMRPMAQKDTLSIIRTMNKLSQKMVDGVQGEVNADMNANGDGQEELKAHELQLNDLEPKSKLSGIVLDLHKQGRGESYGMNDNDAVLGKEKTIEITTTAIDQTPSEIVSAMVRDAVPSGTVQELLQQAAIVNPSEISTLPVRQAQAQIVRLVGSQRDVTGEWELPSTDANTIRDMKLSHTTAIEFLNHFWTTFLSGDASRASSSLPLLVSSVENSKTRLLAVVERHMDLLKQQQQQQYDVEKERARIKGYVSVSLNALERSAATYYELLRQQQQEIDSGTGTPW
ncbi:hypothetical protein V1514DRAFT_352085 [Lipomyces japonicus]|uniref:uncharacterized protein n=1 Tax=Lipomyces japonicus TaxID=56871 RepID=UPI0034CFD9B1